MPCLSTLNPNQTLQQRMAEVDVALKKLEQSLTNRVVNIVIGSNGAITFGSWKKEDRSGISDVCAYRSLMATGSSALRMAVMRAEQMSGRKVNVNAIVAGVHSHDGGRTWSKH